MEIRFLLEKYKKLTVSQENIKNVILEVFNECNLEIEKKEILVTKNNEIQIKVSGVKRLEFILLKNKLNLLLEEKFKEKGLKVMFLI